VIDTILFDAEGVVIDTEPLWDQAQEEFLRRRDCRYDRSRLKPLLSGRSLLESTAILQVECGLKGDPAQFAQERLSLVKELLTSNVSFIPGFADFHLRVQSRFKTGLATAMAEELLALADQRLRLADLFKGRVYSLRMVGGRAKPNPDLFLLAARDLNSEPSNCLVIEDAPHGIEAARRAGMKCVALTTTYPAKLLGDADAIFDSFAQIDQFLTAPLS
jgi:beta-phosphoglucomutase